MAKLKLHSTAKAPLISLYIESHNRTNALNGKQFTLAINSFHFRVCLYQTILKPSSNKTVFEKDNNAFHAPDSKLITEFCSLEWHQSKFYEIVIH